MWRLRSDATPQLQSLPTVKLQLLCHPSAHSAAIKRIEGSIRRTPGLLHCVWRLEGEIGLLRLPHARQPVREDGLWRHTCCEVFVASAASVAYVEGNFSPSGAWAAYTFSGYRENMLPAMPERPPEMSIEVAADYLELTATWAAPSLLADTSAWDAGLAVVVEDRSGTLSYWALAHNADRPDFHARDTFRYPLPVVS